MSLCLHCQHRNANASRGLCRYCYRVPEIRQQYPVLSKWVSGAGEFHEPTAEELEATIAEQRANLPDWWHDSWVRDDE